MEKIVSFIEDKTSRKLAEALVRLMETEPFDQISSSQIINLSGISRSTFYRKYTDKYDLLNGLYQWILDATIMKVPAGSSFREAFYRLYEILKEYPVFFRNALQSRETNSLRNYIFSRSYEMYDRILRAEGVDMDSTYYRMLVTGYISGTLELTCRWAERGMKEEIDLLFRLTYELLPHELQTIMALKYM